MFMSLRAAFAFCVLSILPPGSVLAAPGVWRPPAADNVTLLSLRVRGDRALALGVTREGYQTRAPVRAYWLSLEIPNTPRLLATLALPDYYDEIADDNGRFTLWSQKAGLVAFVAPTANEAQLTIEKRLDLRSLLIAEAEAARQTQDATGAPQVSPEAPAIWQIQREANRLWVRSEVGLLAIDLQTAPRVLARLADNGAFLVDGTRLYRAVRRELAAPGEFETLLEIRDANQAAAAPAGQIALPGFCCATRIVVQDGVAIVLDIEMRRIARIDVRTPAAPRLLAAEDDIAYFDARSGADGYYALSSPYGETLSLWRLNFATGSIAATPADYGPGLEHRNQFGVHDGRLFLITQAGELRVLSPTN